MRIVRLWLFKSREVIKPGLAWPPGSKVDIQHEVFGEFKHFWIDGESAQLTNRKEAKRWELLTGRKVETIMGYPAFMHDLGYRI